MDVRGNVFVDCIALVIALVAIADAWRGKRRGDAYQKRFWWLLIVNCLILFMDMLAWLCDGQPFPGARGVCFAANTGYYAMQIVYCWLWMLFAYDWANRFQAMPRKTALLFALPLIAELAALMLNGWTGHVFFLNDKGYYVRGSRFVLNLIPYLLYMLGALYVIIRAWATARDEDRKRHGVVLLVGMLMPISGSVIETFYYGMSFTWPMAALSLLLISLSAQQEQNALNKAEAASAKAELAESQMAIMLSQIQPHFLYNSLTVISELCETDPVQAQYATQQFASFLRGNMSSLSAGKPIPFEVELRHTQSYLALEEMRFSDRLTVAFDIQATQFRLPTLTLQPIVENAVRYGVTKRPEGGTVIVSSRETEDGFRVTVSDDGVGFDPLLPKADGRAHIGITNVRDRLRRMVNGTLEIVSTPGKGTVATITIPKEALSC